MELIGIQVSHSQWGNGQIIAHDGKVLTVEFPGKITRFIYPDAIGTHIQATDSAIHAAILQDIEDAKAAEIAKQKEIEETVFKASAGGVVTVEVYGTKELKSVKILLPVNT